MDRYLPRLLLWLDDRRRENPIEYADLAPFAEQEALELDTVENLATVLEQQGYVRTARGLDNRPDSLISDRGRVEAQVLRERRIDPAARLRYAQNTVIKWMFDHHRVAPVNLVDFMVAPESYFFGDHLTVDELTTTVRYLGDRKLITASGGQTGLRLTADGMDCVISEESVSDYMASQRKGGDTYNVHDSQGSVIGGQHQTVNQTNSFGFNPAEVRELISFANLVQQLAPTLGLPEQEQADLVEGADALELEAGSTASDGGRLRRATERVLTTLSAATKVTGALTVLIDKGHQAYTTVFGG